MSRFFPTVQTWIVSKGVLETSFRQLRQDGLRGCEGIVLWAGSRSQGNAHVRCTIIPEGPGVIKRSNLVWLNDSVMAAVSDLLSPPDLVLIGQVHTHGIGVRHSSTDNAHIISTPGYLSVVMSEYALHPQWDPGRWGVHVGAGPGFTFMSPTEARGRIRFVEGGVSDVRRVRA